MGALLGENLEHEASTHEDTIEVVEWKVVEATKTECYGNSMSASCEGSIKHHAIEETRVKF